MMTNGGISMKRSMNTLRRLLALALVLVMVGSLFAGCNKKEADPTVPSETQGMEQTEAPTDAATEAPTEEPTEAPTEPAETVPPVLIGTVNADNLNVRAEPYSTGTDILKRLAINTRIEILEQKIVDGINWGRTADGWVNLNYVTIGVEFPEPGTNDNVVDNPNNVGTGTNAADSNTSTTGTISTGLNIRKEADADSAAVGTYKKGDKVTILERSGDWGRTNKGWINTKYVDFTNSVTADSSSSSSSGGGITTTVSNGNKVILGYGTVVKTTSLAIRSGPGTSYSQVSYVRMGERHPYYQTSSNGWVRFQKGWVNADYLSLEYVVVDGTEVTVTATTLSVREEADYNSERLATLAKGDKVIIVDTKGTWGMIEYSNGQYGWIDLDQVDLPVPEVSNYAPGVATITADALHIRAKASYTSDSLGTYTKGTKVTVTEVNGNWGKTADGWINLKFTTMEKVYAAGSGIITASKLNIRSKPSTSGDELGTLKSGDKVTILDTEGNWGKIEYKSGKYGWISLKYVQMVSISGSSTNTSGYYTVNIARCDNGTVSASTTSCTKGTTVTLSATPASGCTLNGYYVVDANGTVIPVTNGKFVMPAANVTVSATFTAGTPAKYAVTVNAAANGTVTASKTTDILAGTKVALTIAPASGYQLSSILVQDGYGNSISLASDYTFVMPTSNVIITPTFVSSSSSATLHTINIGATTNGVMTSTLSSAAKGSVITLTATPDEGYQLSSVTVTSGGNSLGVIGSGNTRTFTMPDAAVNVSAQFVKTQYTVSVSSVTGGTVSADPTTCGIGTTVTVTATANTGYTLTGIKVYGTGDRLVASGSSGMTFSMPAENVTVVPSFAKNPRNIAAPTASISGATVTVSPASSAVPGSTVTLTMECADDRFEVKSVVVKAGENSITVSGSGNTRTFTMPEADVTEITVTYGAIGVYKVIKSGGTHLYDAQNSDNALVAIPEGETVYARAGSNSSWIKAGYGGYVGWIRIEGRLQKQ